MRSPITGMVIQFQGLTPEEQKVFLDLVDPQPEPEQSNKKPPKSRKGQCATCDYPKAASIHHDSKLVGYHVYQPTAQKRGLPSTKTVAPAANTSSCTAKIPGSDETCSQLGDNPIHDPNGGYGGYHEFEAPKSKKAAAQK